MSCTISTQKIVFPCGMSRSGTTLLTTVLDSHSKISLGYELLPVDLPTVTEMLSALGTAVQAGDPDLLTMGKHYKNSGEKTLGSFLTRVARSGLDKHDLHAIFTAMRSQGRETGNDFHSRLDISYRVVERKQAREGGAMCGFKLNSPAYEDARKYFPGSYFVYIVRDPRDVWASHIKRRFNRTVDQVGKAWVNYLDRFQRLQKAHPDVTRIVRYEDLVTHPETAIPAVFDILPVDLEQSVFEFYKSSATVHEGNHPNAHALRQNFFTSSISSWQSTLPQQDVDTINKLCDRLMIEQGYSKYG